MRLIDAAELKNYIDCGHLRSPTETCFSEIDVVRMIDKQPTIDAETVRHGQWKRDNTRRKSYRRMCTACGKIAYHCFETRDYNYCPNCGARMDGDDNAAD